MEWEWKPYLWKRFIYSFMTSLANLQVAYQWKNTFRYELIFPMVSDFSIDALKSELIPNKRN